MIDNKYTILKKYFGYTEFRKGQEELIDALLSKQDVLGIMPTGAGKSICYQVPALLFEGITLVVSPLISLMKDQVSSLNQAGIHAAYFNSSLTQNQYEKALAYAKEGRYKIIYVAPERLLTERFLDFALSVPISFVSVDEVHCVSQWGQDFRPSYLKVIDFIRMLPKRPVVGAFTATATEVVKDDVLHLLDLQNPYVITTGFDRSNLKFMVKTPNNRFQELYKYIGMHKSESGIVYCITRKNVDAVCQKLEEKGLSVTKYHAGLSDAQRQRNQDDFVNDRKQIMVATNAFGMGIDKSDVRYVVHYNMPKNMESYYQEAGRAGRDGMPSECLLFYNGQDVITNQLFIEQSRNEELTYDDVLRVQEQDRERLQKMILYSTTTECLRRYMLGYFGEMVEGPCGNCSNCLSVYLEEDVANAVRAIVGCVDGTRERYGIMTILNTLHGSAVANVKKYGLNETEYFGALKEYSIAKLKQIADHLIMQEYMYTTKDQYAIFKMNKEAKIWLEEDQSYMMKFAEEEEEIKPKNLNKGNKRSKDKITLDKNNKGNKASLEGMDDELFEILKSLRMKLAKEAKVPAYIVFTDKSLSEMSIKKPVTKEEMLDISGVAEAKYSKYGEEFIQEIKNYLEEKEK